MTRTRNRRPLVAAGGSSSFASYSENAFRITDPAAVSAGEPKVTSEQPEVLSVAPGSQLERHLQLRLDDNHPTVQARQRAVAAAVRAGTYRGRNGRSHPFQARHRDVMWWLCAYANTKGEIHPRVMTLGKLAEQLERPKDNVLTDVRDLETAGLMSRRPIPGTRGLFVYLIPGMAAPLKVAE